MTDTERTAILQSTVDTWGEAPQIDMMVEECAELIQASSKWERNATESTKDHVCEEIADVQIMLDQMKLIFGAAPVARWEEMKLVRLRDRIGVYLYERFKESEESQCV